MSRAWMPTTRPSPTGSSGASSCSTRGLDLGLVGSGVLDIEENGEPRDLHLHDAGRASMRWRALFSAPVFHNTVVLQRELLETHGLRYDTSFGESEDYELWTRVLAVAEGDCIEAPLVLHRLHAQQASRRRGDLQRTLAEEVSLRQIAGVAPELSARRAGLAREVWLGAEIAAADVENAATAFVELERTFEAEHAFLEGELAAVRAAAARALAGLAARARGTAGAVVLSEAVRLDPLLPAHVGHPSRSAAHAHEARGARRGRPAPGTRRGAGCAADPGRGRLPGAHAVPRTAPRPRRRAPRDRPDRRLRGGNRRGTHLARRAEAPSGLPPRPPRPGRRARAASRLPADAGRRSCSRGRPTRRRRRLRVEHLRRPGGDRLVPGAGHPVHPGRGEPRRGASPGLASNGEGHRRPADRGERGGRSRHRDARPQLDDRPRGAGGPRARIREHRGRRGVRCECVASRGTSIRSFDAHSERSSDDVVVLSVARLAPEKGLDDLVRAVDEAADEHLPARRRRGGWRTVASRAARR